MKVSQSWLKQYVVFKLSPKQFVEGLTMLGLEVEGYEDLAKKYDNFFVGEVVERAKHPNADRLTVCKVNIGKVVLEIVCGAPNVAAGQKVAVAIIGATIPHNQHDPEGNPFVLSNAKIRGVESNGMICSASELGLGEDADGILILDPSAPIGTPLAKFLGQNDVIYEIGITPNRGDCLSHIGVAREVALVVNKKVKLPTIKLAETKQSAAKHAKVRILDKKRCPRYAARILRNVKIQSSPGWLQNILTSVGVRPINVVVDVTNYVMLEMGQPLHAFDYDRIAGHKIIVKTAQEEDVFTTLDGKQRKLTPDTLMICDAEKPIAIAGVMGGLNSEISESTTNILIESAFFNPQNIRRTSRATGLSTEASYRFERGVDVEGCVRAADRAAQLIQELTGSEVLKDALDVYPGKRKRAPIKVRVDQTNRILGTSLSGIQITNFLKKLDIKVQSVTQRDLKALPPTFRTDLVEEIDLIEEVARVYGYENIETKTKAGIDFASSVAVNKNEDQLREYLIGSGFNELQAISLQEEKTAAITGLPAVKVLNPVSAEMQVLRTSLVPGALQIARHNIHRGSMDLRLFEMGTTFLQVEGKRPDSLEAYEQKTSLLLLLFGNHAPVSYSVPGRKVDLLDMKGEVEAILKKFSLDKYRLIYYDTHSALSDKVVNIEIKGTYAGSLGSVKKQVLKAFDIEDDLYVCELNVEALLEAAGAARKVKPPPKFPSVTRDLAFVVEDVLPQVKVEEAIRAQGGPVLREVTLFDTYAGAQTGAGKKSLAFALEFQSPDKTMTDEEIDRLIARIVQGVQRECNAVLRS